MSQTTITPDIFAKGYATPAKPSRTLEAIILIVAMVSAGVAFASLGNPVLFAIGAGIIVTTLGFVASWAAVKYVN